jgi:thiamine biosynthesis lipoprotein
LSEPRTRSSVNAGRSPAAIVLIGLLGLGGIVYLLWPKPPLVEHLARSEAGSAWQLRVDRALLRGPSMGTSFTVVLSGPALGWDRAALGRLQTEIDAELQAVNAEMSTYLVDSELSRFNRAPAGKPVVVGPNLLEVVRLAKQVSAQSNGAFDVTVGPLVDAWGFGPGGHRGDPDADERSAPTPERIAELQVLVGDAKLELDAGASTLRKRVPGLQVDLSAIAKGHGCDRVAAVLEAAGHHDYMVEIGGELRLSGANPGGEGWAVAIERPTADAVGVQAVHSMFELTDVAVATSGDYRNYWTRGETRYSHTIDPRTGRPITHALASVTVVHPESAALADAWATALDVLGPDEGLALAERLDLAAYFLVRTDTGFEVRASAGFGPYLDP